MTENDVRRIVREEIDREYDEHREFMKEYFRLEELGMYDEPPDDTPSEPQPPSS